MTGAALPALARFPAWTDAPARLQHLDGHCGPLAVWGVLRYYGVRRSAAAIIRSVRHNSDGAFTIGLAVALAEEGFDAAFHSDPDPDIHPNEVPLYDRARKLGLRILPAVGLHNLQRALGEGWIPIVFYRQPGGGHFSPLLGHRHGRVLLPYDQSGGMTVSAFGRRWRGAGYPRQTVLARRAPASGRLSAAASPAGPPPSR